jgi:hypothetical protein
MYSRSRGEHFSGQAGFGQGRKKLLFRAEKILLITIPLDVFGSGPGLGGPPAYFIV